MKITKALPSSVTTVRDEFDRIFDQLRTNGLFGPAPRVFESLWSPSLDFSENEKEYLVRLEAPGIPRDDLEVNIDGQTLTVSGHRDFQNEEKTEEYFWREREAGKFMRTVQLPAAIDRGNVSAVYQDGIMTIRLPKAEPSVATRVPIK
jgi:HSP20 family protein